jgi:anti-sigma factor RsiW
MTISSGHDPILLVHAYLDGELDPAHVIEMEQRLAADPALAAERDRIVALRRAIGERLPRHPVPDGLADRIETALGMRRVQARPSWRALAAAVIAAAVIASAATWFALRPVAVDAAELVVASHVRALMAPQPTDVGCRRGMAVCASVSCLPYSSGC